MITIGTVPIPFDPERFLNGAFAYIQNITHETDIIKNNYIKLSVSSSINGNLKVPINQKDIENVYFQSSNEVGSWYEIDFINNFFYLETYLLRARAHDFFSEWKIYGSNDGKNYQIVDEIFDFPYPNGDFVNLNFTCKYPSTNRIFRFVPNGLRYGNDNITIIHRIEFFGSFISSRLIHNESIKNWQNIFTFNFLLFTIVVLCL